MRSKVDLRAMCAAISILTGCASLAAAQDYRQPLEYLAGHGGMKSQTVWLVVNDSSMIIENVNLQKELVVIPLTAITSVEASTEDKGPSTGQKVMWGQLAGHSHEELITISYSTENDAEALVFKTRKEHTAPGIVAKIELYRRKANAK